MAEEKRREEYEALTVAQLKEQLRGRGLPVSGTKDELVQRLLEVIAMEAIAPAAEPADVVGPEATESKAEVEPQERKCDTCKQPYVPAKPEFKHCPRCHAKWQFEQDAPRAQAKLAGAKTAFGRYNNYGPAETLFSAAKDYYRKGEFEAAVRTLRSTSDEVDLVTAQGSLEYARGLMDEAEECGVSVDARVSELVGQVEAALFKPGGPKPWRAARDANELREALRALSPQLREAKASREREDFLLRLEEDSQPQKMQRGGGSKKGLG